MCWQPLNMLSRSWARWHCLPPLANFCSWSANHGAGCAIVMGWGRRINTVVRALNPAVAKKLRGSFHPGFPTASFAGSWACDWQTNLIRLFSKEWTVSRNTTLKWVKSVLTSSPDKVESFYWEEMMNSGWSGVALTVSECVLDAGWRDDVDGKHSVDSMTATFADNFTIKNWGLPKPYAYGMKVLCTLVVDHRAVESKHCWLFFCIGCFRVKCSGQNDYLTRISRWHFVFELNPSITCDIFILSTRSSILVW